MPSPFGGHPATASQELLRRAFALQKQGRLTDAEALYLQILERQPREPQALHFLGVLVLEQKQVERGVELIRQALAIQPGYAQAYGSLALGLEALGRPEDAVASYGRLIALMPGHAGALHNRGRILDGLGRHEAALADFDRALALQLSPAAAVDRGVTLMALHRPTEALASFEHAIALSPDYAVAHYNRGATLMQQQELRPALAAFSKAISCRPDYAEAFAHRGNILRALNRIPESLADMDKAVTLRPDFAQGHDNRGLTLVELGRIDEALASYDRALAVDPGYTHACFNKSLALLLMGRLPEGWRLYESRKQLDWWHHQHRHPQPLWQGENLTGKDLFVYWEQGLGDTIQFCRYAALAAARGAKVILSVQDRLVRLLGGFAPGVEVVGETVVPDHFDMHASLLDLPLAFGTTLGTVPAAMTYLAAEPERMRHWRQRLGDDGFKIGVVWQGNRPRNVAASRSFPLACLRQISAIAGARLISLQKNDDAGQLAASNMNIETLGADFDAGPDAFVDTAAVMMQCDLIITCDTSIAHLAGALGRPVWVALNHVPEWRWQMERGDSAWYPTMTLFRQKAHGDWNSVFAAMAECLTENVVR